MKDFNVAPVDQPDTEGSNQNLGESALERFRRISKLVASKTANIKWNEVIKGAASEAYSQIGRCRNRESFKNQQNLLKAMEQARKLIEQGPMSPTPTHSPNLGYVDETSRTLVALLKNISEELKEISPHNTLRVKAPGTRAKSPLQSLNVQLQSLISKTPSPSKFSGKPKIGEITSMRATSVDGTLSTPHSILKNRSPTPDSSKSLDIPSIEIEHFTQPSGDDGTDNSPLKHSIESPIEVVKRKAPKPIEDIAVSRPAIFKSPFFHGMLPPPPSKDEIKPLQVIPILSTTPATPLPSVKAMLATPESYFECQEQVTEQVTIERTTSEEPSSPVMIAASSLTLYRSTENLVAAEKVEDTPTSPSSLRPVNKIEDVKTIKRQAKTGWL